MRWFVLIGSFVLATVIAAAAAHFFEDEINPLSTAVFIEKRMKHIFKSIPRLEATAERSILVWGASEVEGSLVPEHLEAELHRQGMDFQVFNLAIRSMDMRMIRDMAAGFDDRMNDPEKRFAGVLLKLPLARLTASYARYSFLLDRLPIDAAALSWSRLPTTIYAEPERGTAMAIEKIVWSTASPRYFMSWLQMLPPYLDYKMKRPEGHINIFHSLWIYPVFLEKPEWDFQKKGLYTFNLPSARADYDFFVREKQKPHLRKRGVENFIQCCDLVDLNFDPDLVQDAVAAIRELQSLSDHVLVLMPPESSDIRSLRTPESRVRLENLKTEIHRATGVKIIDWSDETAAFEDHFYIDILHMNEAGWNLTFPRIAKELKESYAAP